MSQEGGTLEHVNVESSGAVSDGEAEAAPDALTVEQTREAYADDLYARIRDDPTGELRDRTIAHTFAMTREVYNLFAGMRSAAGNGNLPAPLRGILKMLGMS